MYTDPKEGFNTNIAYDYYKAKYEAEFGTPLYISRREFMKLCGEYNRMLMEELSDGKIVDLPCGLGALNVQVKPLSVFSKDVDLEHKRKTGETSESCRKKVDNNCVRVNKCEQSAYCSHIYPLPIKVQDFSGN